MFSDLGLHLHNEENHKSDQKRRLQVLEARGIPSYGYRRDESEKRITELPNGDSPCVSLESEVQNDLGDNRIDSTVEDPAFYSKGKHGEGEIRVSAEENMCN